MSASLDRRRIVPELLDALAPDDAGAVGSRRDLAWINALILQSRIMAGLLRRHVSTPPGRILELGSGDGRFMLAVARRMGNAWRGADLVMVDQMDLLSESTRNEFSALGWRAEPVVSDIFEWISRSGDARFDVVCANLVLHHFSDDVLSGLFNSMQKLAPVFVATEPRRNVVALASCSLLKLIGVNEVTKHDAAASVRAGFAGNELTALWPANHEMRFEERRLGPFTHAFAARRIA
jgi:SAM-dependent methyltransferase